MTLFSFPTKDMVVLSLKWKAPKNTPLVTEGERFVA
ncbi:uncharacterized protein METZ01_LOCUS13886 [marine metagenome]|uniref:Uncharacterized protein n=1 Tax=marine metagenome TaxID=408172 RepID=A0A381P2B4_9ZZZZ